MNVAVVDDDPSVRRSLERLLRSAGFGVITFESAEQFLALCRAEEVSCVLVDVHLGGMSGIELHQALRKAGGSTPIVLFSGHDDSSTLDAMRSTGAMYLRKPFDDEELLAAIGTCVGQRAKR